MKSNIRALVLVAITVFAINSHFLFAQSGKKPEQEQIKDPFKKKNQRPSPHPSPEATEGTATPPDMVGKPDSQDVVKVTTNLVPVEATVYHKKTKQLIKNLPKERFAVFEDGIQKEVTYFSASEAPITVTLVVEYSKLGELLGFYGVNQGGNQRQVPGKFEVLMPMSKFLSEFIKPPNDYASVIAFDLRPTPITDFTNDPNRIQQVINFLLVNHPAFSDSNLFDALQLSLIGGTADSVALENSQQEKSEYAGMATIQGRHKAIILVACGIDTFSKINYDDARKIAQNAGVPIYIIQTGQMFFDQYGDSRALDPGQWGVLVTGGIRLDKMMFLQAQNSMRTFAKETGGHHYLLRRLDELPAQLNEINESLRHQYSLGYNPGDIRDGKQHKIIVKVDIDGDGKFDDKEIKDYEISHRRYYNSPKPDKK